MSFPLLETPRLRLRELTLDDAPALLAIHGDGPAMRHFGTDPLTTLAEAEDLVRRFAAWRQQPHPGVRWGWSAVPMAPWWAAAACLPGTPAGPSAAPATS